jgi:hypothetical protein
MMKKVATIFLLTIGLLLLTFCDRPTCMNENQVFDKFSPKDEVYKRELSKQLKTINKSNLRYWSYDYVEENGSRFLFANVQNEEICAIIVLTIDKSEKGIEHLIEKKNKSYRGAELEDLKFDIKEENGKVEFVFLEVSGIWD